MEGRGEGGGERGALPQEGGERRVRGREGQLPEEEREARAGPVVPVSVCCLRCRGRRKLCHPCIAKQSSR